MGERSLRQLGRLFRALLAVATLLAVTATIAAWVAAPIELPPPSADAEPAAASPGEPAVTEPAWIAVRADALVRVALTNQAATALRLKIAGPWRAVALAASGIAINPTAALQPSVTMAPLPEQPVSVKQGRLRLGGQSFPATGVEIVPEQSPGIWVQGRLYRGSVRLHVTDAGRLWAVNVLPLEDYVAAVVDGEMPAAFPTAAREAQAIAARTYAVSFLVGSGCDVPVREGPFDVFASPISQNYLGVTYTAADGRLLAGETAAGRAAALATAGQVLTDRGHLFRAYYSACCGGVAADGRHLFHDAATPLAGVTCDHCRDAPLYRWQRSLAMPADLAPLTRLARSKSGAFGDVHKVTPQSTTAGELPKFRLSDGRRTVLVTAIDVRAVWPEGLPSLFFTLNQRGNRLIAEGRGHGHGVGLCQWGAKGLADAGRSRSDILSYYYPGSEVRPLPAAK